MFTFHWEDTIDRIALDIYAAQHLSGLIGSLMEAKELREYLISVTDPWGSPPGIVQYLDSEMEHALKVKKSWSENEPADLDGVIAWDDRRAVIGETYYDVEVISRKQCDANAL